MYSYQEVPDNEGISLAREFNCMFQKTSAKNETGGGIDELFKIIGKKFLDPTFEEIMYLSKEERKLRGEKVLREKIKNEQSNKRGCC